jgi:hypothetical protein
MEIEAKLQSKLEKIYPEHSEREKASEVLAEYGKEAHEQEPIRVRLAILKMAGPSIEKLHEFTSAAKGDFRDVLSWAEYPRQSKHWSVTGAKKEKLVSADLNEYETWLNT